MLKKFLELKNNFFIKFLLFASLNDFGMFYSLYNYIFACSQMSVFEISTILSACQIGKILFDIPTALLNDKLNKKAAFYIGLLAKIIAMFIFINYKSYWHFLTAMFLIGISWSCTFGKIESFLYSEIKDKSNFSKKLGITYACINLSISAASYLCANIKNIDYILKLQIAVYLIALLILFIIKIDSTYATKTEEKFEEKFSIFKNIKTNLSQFIKYLKTNKRIKSFIILSIFLESLFIIMIDLNTNLMVKFNFSKENISKVVSIVAFIRIFTNLLAGYISRFLNIKIFTIYLLGIFAQILFFTSFIEKFSFVSISIYLCFYTPLSLFALNTIQESIPNEKRNLILSSVNMLTSIVSIIIDFSFGFIGWINGIRLLSILVIIFTIFTHKKLNSKTDF